MIGNQYTVSQVVILAYSQTLKNISNPLQSKIIVELLKRHLLNILIDLIISLSTYQVILF